MQYTKNIVAYKIHLPQRRLLALCNLKHEVDAAVATLDNFGHHPDIVAPGMPISFHDAADIGLHEGALQRATRLGFDYCAKLFVLDLLVAFESDAIEYRGFGEMHNQPLPRGMFDCHVLEHAGPQQ